MKNILKTFTVSMICGVMLNNRALAQTAVTGFSANNATSSSVSIAGTIGAMDENSNALSGMNARALKNFQETFKGVSNASWSQVDGGFIASFSMDSVQTRADYNQRGAWMHTLRYYGEKKLPREVRDQVKRTYYDYEILNVIEVNLSGEVVYMVYLRDDTHLKSIKVHDSELEELHTYTRG